MSEKDEIDRDNHEVIVAATAQRSPEKFERLLQLSGGMSTFTHPPARVLMELLQKRIPAGLPVDHAALTLSLSAAELRRIGGPGAFPKMFENALPDADMHAEELYGLALMQDGIGAAGSIAHRLSTDRDRPAAFAAAAEKFTELHQKSLRVGQLTASVGSWAFADLDSVLDGTYEPVMPTVGARDDGVGLFYPGRLNDVSGESEGGKTWLALIGCITEINRSNHVVYLDFEDDAGGVVSRVLLLGAKPDQIREYFHYVRPDVAPGKGDIDLFLRLIQSVAPTLVVLDGVTEAMAMFGMELKDNTEIAVFGQQLLRPLAGTGAALVTLDHVVKNGDNRGRYSLGGVHKLNGINGVKYIVEAVAPFGIGLTGRSRVRIAKDRPAQLRKHALPGGERMHWFADLVVESRSETCAYGHLYAPYEKPAEVSQGTPEEQAEQKEAIEIADLEKQILTVLSRAKLPLNKTGIEDRVKGRNVTVRKALARLVDDGRVVTEEGPRKAVLHSLPVPELPLVDGAA